MFLLVPGALAASVPAHLWGLVGEAAAQTGDQPDWRFCNKCNAVFYSGAPDKGRCPAGGAHVPQGFLFSLHYDSRQAGSQRIQYAWRYCVKCRALFYDGFPGKGRCPADGGGHAAQGLMFGLDFQPPAGQHQGSWRFCRKCNVLFWDGAPAKGRCPVGGGHTAQGLNFHLLFKHASDDPRKAITDVIHDRIEANRAGFENAIKAELGRGDMIANGVTLYNINLRLATGDTRFSGGSFEHRMNDNYMYFKSTTPTVFGSYGDPAFETHFDVMLAGPIIVPAQGKPRVGNVIARVPRITVSPRNVTGGVVTTVVRFFQEAGGRGIIEAAVDRHLNQRLTDRINEYLQRF
jgi:hypothetical protein